MGRRLSKLFDMPIGRVASLENGFELRRLTPPEPANEERGLPGQNNRGTQMESRGTKCMFSDCISRSWLHWCRISSGHASCSQSQACVGTSSFVRFGLLRNSCGMLCSTARLELKSCNAMCEFDICRQAGALACNVHAWDMKADSRGRGPCLEGGGVKRKRVPTPNVDKFGFKEYFLVHCEKWIACRSGPAQKVVNRA